VENSFSNVIIFVIQELGVIRFQCWVVNETPVEPVELLSVLSTAGGGFLMVGSNRNLIGGNDVIGSGNYGMSLTSPTAGGPSTSGSSGNELVKNNISSTKSGPGVRIGIGDMNIIADNVANSNSAGGILIQTADNLVQQNTVNNNLDRGILANGPGAVGNVFRTNTARGNRVDLQDDNLLSCVNTSTAKAAPTGVPA
jgi:parallel beta-helix repeat protein